MAKDVHVQVKARQEIDKLLIDNQEIDVNVLEKLNYLEQCIKETLRLAPSVPMISRTLTEDVPIGCSFAIIPIRLTNIFDMLQVNIIIQKERFS